MAASCSALGCAPHVRPQPAPQGGVPSVPCRGHLSGRQKHCPRGLSQHWGRTRQEWGDGWHLWQALAAVWGVCRVPHCCTGLSWCSAGIYRVCLGTCISWKTSLFQDQNEHSGLYSAPHECQPARPHKAKKLVALSESRPLLQALHIWSAGLTSTGNSLQTSLFEN